MIERILIQNFQSHDKFRIDFDPGITCIVGPSDVGKSAILRALRWVCTNQPGGDAFVRHGTKGAMVRLLVDGHSITRRRSPGGDVNEYHLDEQVFKAFGRAVPEPIEALLGLGPVCWQGQHDAPYWFGTTAGEVSRQLNSIVNLGIIDDTLAGVGRAVHKARTKLELAEEELTRAKREHDSLAWVGDFSVAVAELEAQENDCTDKRTKAVAASALYQAILGHKATQKKATVANVAGQVLVELGEKAIEARKRVETIRKLVVNFKQYHKAANVAVPNTKTLESAMAKYREANQQAARLRALMKDINKWEVTKCQLETDLKKAEAAIPQTCPTCKQYWSPTSISKPKPQ